jgi:hypothetical protein
MSKLFRGSITLMVLAALAATVFQVQTFAGRRDCCCNVCQHPVRQCVCAVPQTSYQPVYETQYVQQPVLQQRDVPVTEYRTEAVNESVPTTVYENVMVDEGSYQTVWVPRMTSKTVAKTVYQNRTSYRSVPYQTTRRISEYTTQTIPQQTVRYVPSTTNSLVYSTTPGYYTAGVPYSYTAPGVAYGTYPYTSAPIVSSAPVVTGSPTVIGSSLAPAPDPRFATSVPTPVAPRTASSDPFATSSSTTPATGSRTADRGPALFTPAPSAATVWRSHYGTNVR